MKSENLYFRQWKAGKIDAFYKQLYPQMLSYAIRALGDYAFMAEDCVQNSFVKAYLHRHEYKEYLHFKSFLYLCTRNEIISILRHNQAQSNYLSYLQDETSPACINAIIEEETYTILYQTIQELPADLRKLFELSFIKEMTNAEIAEHMHLSERTIKRKKALMISLLRETLVKRSDFDPTIFILLMTYLQDELS